MEGHNSGAFQTLFDCGYFSQLRASRALAGSMHIASSRSLSPHHHVDYSSCKIFLRHYLILQFCFPPFVDK